MKFQKGDLVRYAASSFFHEADILVGIISRCWDATEILQEVEFEVLWVHKGGVLNVNHDVDYSYKVHELELVIRP
jgi:hypothetical protein